MLAEIIFPTTLQQKSPPVKGIRVWDEGRRPGIRRRQRGETRLISMSRSFDVVIIGGGVIGSSVAYFLAAEPAFTGSIAVIEKDPTYAEAATPRSAGGIRQQFSTPENVLISSFGASFVKSVAEHLSVG